MSTNRQADQIKRIDFITCFQVSVKKFVFIISLRILIHIFSSISTGGINPIQIINMSGIKPVVIIQVSRQAQFPCFCREINTSVIAAPTVNTTLQCSRISCHRFFSHDINNTPYSLCFVFCSRFGNYFYIFNTRSRHTFQYL